MSQIIPIPLFLILIIYIYNCNLFFSTDGFSSLRELRFNIFFTRFTINVFLSTYTKLKFAEMSYTN